MAKELFSTGPSPHGKQLRDLAEEFDSGVLKSLVVAVIDSEGNSRIVLSSDNHITLYYLAGQIQHIIQSGGWEQEDPEYDG